MGGESKANPPQAPPGIPGRPRRRIWPWVFTLLALVGVVAAWALWPRRTSFYTDADRIHQPVHVLDPRDVLWQPPTRLAAPINSNGDDYEPRVSADGMTLFFVRGKAGENADIYVSRRTPKFSRDSERSAVVRTPDAWSHPEPLGAVNSSDDDLGPEPSPDGSALYFYSNRAGGHGGYDVWVSHRGDDGWRPPVNIGPKVNSPYNDYGPALSPDGATLYFASNRPQPKDTDQVDEDAWQATIREDLFSRDYDLFTAAITDQGVSEASSLTELNSAHNEGAPAVSPAGDFLYFASDRPGGEGGFDLYRSRRLRGKYLPPMPLGVGVNTRANELDPALSLGGFGLHFSSDRPLPLAREQEVREGILEPAVSERPSGERPRYQLYQTVSREVFTETQVHQASVDWAGLWREIGPSLLLALLTLLLLLLLLKYLGGLRNRNLSLLVRCVLASMFLHLLLLFLLSFWDVTASIAGAFRRPGGVKVALVSPAQGREIEHQILAALTQVQLESHAIELAQASPPLPALPTESTTVDIKPGAVTIEVARALPVQTDPADSQAKLPEIHQPNPQWERSTPPEITLPASTPAPPAADTEFRLEARASTAPAARLPDKAETPPESATVEVAPHRTEATVESAPLPTAPTADSITEAHPELAAARPSPAMPDVPLASAATDDFRLPPATAAEPAAPETPAPRLTSAASSTTKAPPVLPPIVDVSTTELATVAPSAKSAQPPATSLAPRPDLVAVEAAPSVASTMKPAQPTLPAALPKPDLALPAQPPNARAAASQPAVPSESAPTERTPALARAPLADPMGIEAPQQIALAPAPSRVRPSSLATAPRVLTDAPLPRSVSPKPATEPHASLPDALALELRVPTEVAPPENPYLQREIENKEELVTRLGGSDETERAVASALAWLATHQGRKGQWDGDGFDENCGECGGETELEVNVGLSGLALLCFLGANHTHTQDGPYREAVDRGITWILQGQSEDGDLRGGETMYSHGIAAIALSEAYGMTKDPRLSSPVKKAVRFIEAARNERVGGWRYDPGQPGDTSVLGWQIMALKSAKLAGIPVSAESFAAAEAWLDRVSSPTRPGQYAYQRNRRPSPGMTAEGMFVLQLLGHERTDARMIASAKYLAERLPAWDDELDTYYWYYATLALYQHQGEVWKQWNKALTRELLANQAKDGRAAGSWSPEGRWADKGGRIYQTALCTLMLEVYYRYLPLYALPNTVATSRE